jgi:phosphinothricin acetyltransferase
VRIDWAIRHAEAGDLAGILAIYNDVIASSTAVYTETPATLEDRRTWWAERTKQGFDVFVAVEGGEVVGFASFGPFRPWPGYRFTVEHSVHVRADRRGTGVGTALMHEIIAAARRQNKHVLIAGVDAQNTASIQFHERLGFERVAHFRQVGFKFGRWLDLVFLQLMLES